MVSWLDREELKKKGKSKGFQKREGRVYMMSKVKAYYRIQRGKEEQIGDYIQRYEKIAREGQNAGGEVFGEGTRGWHLIR